MARIRTIKPEFWSDATISELSIFTTLFYIGLWNFADDAGRGRARSKELNGLLFGGRDNIDESQIEAALQELSDCGRIVLYVVDGIRLFQILKWAQHQKIDKPTGSRFPAPEGFHEAKVKPTGDLPDTSTNVRRELPEASTTPSGTEGGIWKAEGGSGNLEMGRRKVEGGAGEEGPGETTATTPSDPEEASAPPASAFLEQAPDPPASMHSKPEQPLAERVITVSLAPEKWEDLLKTRGTGPGKEFWRRHEIWDGLEVLSERKEPPRDVAAVLHTSILPEIRAGTKKPARLTINAPPPAPVVSDAERERLIAESPGRSQYLREKAAQFEAQRAEEARRANAEAISAQ